MEESDQMTCSTLTTPRQQSSRIVTQIIKALRPARNVALLSSFPPTPPFSLLSLPPSLSLPDCWIIQNAIWLGKDIVDVGGVCDKRANR